MITIKFMNRPIIKTNQTCKNIWLSEYDQILCDLSFGYLSTLKGRYHAWITLIEYYSGLNISRTYLGKFSNSKDLSKLLKKPVKNEIITIDQVKKIFLELNFS